MKNWNLNTIALTGSCMLVTALLLFNANNGLFWDTVLYGSKIPQYYLSNHFSQLLLPDALDSGHIPAFGMYIALIWKFFGRTLLASHLAILPFALGIVWQLYRLCIRFIERKFAGLALLLLLIDPSLLSQITLVSPDVPLVFFFLLAFNAILENRKWLLSFALLLLFATSMRGMMLSLCLLTLDLYGNVSFKTNIRVLFQTLLKRSLIYMPALLLFIAYYSYHYSVKGWLATHAGSPWEACYVRVDFKGFLFNIGLLGWRLLDFGRIAIWLVFFVLVAKYRKTLFNNAGSRMLLFFTISLFLLFPINLLWAKLMLGHRYFIPFYLTFSLLAAKLLFSEGISNRLRSALLLVWIATIVSGNFWIYPSKIAEGWDSTLAHLPYYKLRHDAIAFLDQSKIPFNEVQTFFPNGATLDEIDLNHDARNFNGFDGTSEYVFYSNVYNVEDAVQDQITNSYREIKRFEKRGVFIAIYRKRQ